MPVWTIGYEDAGLPAFIDALAAAGITRIIDVRAIAASRRAGFAKGALSAGLAARGIGYTHLRGLGTPATGRQAARSGNTPAMQAIFGRHLATPEAQFELHLAAEAVTAEAQSGGGACLLCLERDPARCHRSLVAQALADILPVEVKHLYAGFEPLPKVGRRRA